MGSRKSTTVLLRIRIDLPDGMKANTPCNVIRQALKDWGQLPPSSFTVSLVAKHDYYAGLGERRVAD